MPIHHSIQSSLSAFTGSETVGILMWRFFLISNVSPLGRLYFSDQSDWSLASWIWIRSTISKCGTYVSQIIKGWKKDRIMRIWKGGKKIEDCLRYNSNWGVWESELDFFKQIEKGGARQYWGWGQKNIQYKPKYQQMNDSFSEVKKNITWTWENIGWTDEGNAALWLTPQWADCFQWTTTSRHLILFIVQIEHVCLWWLVLQSSHIRMVRVNIQVKFHTIFSSNSAYWSGTHAGFL